MACKVLHWGSSPPSTLSLPGDPARFDALNTRQTLVALAGASAHGE